MCAARYGLCCPLSWTQIWDCHSLDYSVYESVPTCCLCLYFLFALLAHLSLYSILVLPIVSAIDTPVPSLVEDQAIMAYLPPFHSVSFVYLWGNAAHFVLALSDSCAKIFWLNTSPMLALANACPHQCSPLPMLTLTNAHPCQCLLLPSLVPHCHLSLPLSILSSSAPSLPLPSPIASWCVTHSCQPENTALDLFPFPFHLISELMCRVSTYVTPSSTLTQPHNLVLSCKLTPQMHCTFTPSVCCVLGLSVGCNFRLSAGCVLNNCPTLHPQTVCTSHPCNCPLVTQLTPLHCLP